MIIKQWKDVINSLKLDDEIFVTDAEKRFPFFGNRYDCLSCDVLQKIRVNARVVNLAYLLFEGHCCNLTSVEIGPNEFVLEVFSDGFPQIYLNASCFGPRVQIEIHGEEISKVTCLSQNIHSDYRHNIDEEVMRKIDVLELETYYGVVKLHKT